MDDLVVNGQLTSSIVDDQNTNAATAIGERLVESRPQSILVDDRKTLLDIASLGHGDNAAIVTDIEDTVGLEHRAEHVLDDDRRRRVGDEAGFFMELLGEEVDSEVAVLAGLGRSRDTDDLAGTALQDQEVTDADVVAGDGDGVVGTATTLDIADGLTLAIADTRRATLTVFLLDDYLLALMLVARVEGVENTVGGLLETMTERVVVTFVIVVTHLVVVFVFVVGSCTLVFDVVRRLGAVTEFALGHVVVSFVAIDFDSDFGVGVVTAGVSMAEGKLVS